MGANSLLKTVTRQRRGCNLNPGPFAPESSTLTEPPHSSGKFGIFARSVRVELMRNCYTVGLQQCGRRPVRIVLLCIEGAVRNVSKSSHRHHSASHGPVPCALDDRLICRRCLSDGSAVSPFPGRPAVYEAAYTNPQ